MLKRLFQRLRPLLPYLNILLAGAAYMANEYFVQGFCQPVTWAAWVLGLSTAAFLAWPWLQRAPRAVQVVAMLLQGLSFTVCLYCAWFIGLEPRYYLVGLLLGFLPLLVWVPVFFGVQLWHRMRTAALPYARLWFGLGVLALLPAQLWAEWQYQQFQAAVSRVHIDPRYNAAPYAAAMRRVLPRSYVTERVLGMRFRYHTYPNFEEDGWRPPLHDPLLTVLMRGELWHNDPFYWLGIERRAALYQHLFPGMRAKANCACGRSSDATGYWRWQPEWNPPGVPRSWAGLDSLSALPVRPLRSMMGGR
ncbi:hypothetical protein EJV47_16210 [Hymenobacter gummosus]|uniref:Uncharacterized protein n=1 Tax=Hymenobacter gummosus TaxID=1776032 RepID=A0A431U0U4_9BACT|nr:hypothetical protein [Hymenobacter gummosus]RTQ48514.1 hypothetical protein EJV47_16210 [Hymenobacter gummosus]